ncbi:Crp/Fnr family transcriptional regulator [Amantichitinum ursilacus]|uniref:HTH crp-type domain-containing protein n=1 Tax=Amantichitinum ursilacus TaxID=857265 RepID=A0A0N0XI78_9NEIS|nr:Crp/Fnr family transcriptional regulator [Amantichitinum ursilacus]KPC52589.1 hypothetical protein WG78_12115 [Amantichitinum ursilacus]
MHVGAEKNDLLNMLGPVEREAWRAHIEPMDMLAGTMLCESGESPAYVYFPATCVVSLLYAMENGASAEIAMVGREGMIGVSVIMGGDNTPARALVRNSGMAYRVKSAFVKAAFGRPAVMQPLLRYTQALIAQMAQTAVCNRHHSVDQQLCRWLLASLDRLPGNQFSMTQELISKMLGVRREGITAAALKLQEAGYISYSRGHITVLNRAGLERNTCECYWVVRKEYQRLLVDGKTD